MKGYLSENLMSFSVFVKPWGIAFYDPCSGQCLSPAESLQHQVILLIEKSAQLLRKLQGVKAD